MSSFSGSACILLFLGIVFASGSPLQFISGNLNQNHEKIAQVLELTKPAIGIKPLFSSVINNSCQRREDIQLMNMTLNIYTRIFASILKHRQHNQHHDNDESSILMHKLSTAEGAPAVQALKALRDQMETLKNKLGNLIQDREDIISELNEIKVDDPKVQRKALAEFKEIYQAASVIVHRCGRAHTS